MSQLIILLILFNKNTITFLKSPFPSLQILRGALLLITTCFMFSGLAYLPFAENIAIYMIGPVITDTSFLNFKRKNIIYSGDYCYYWINWSTDNSKPK